MLLIQGNNRIAADKADFNTKTRLGTFYNATGIANIQPPRRSSSPGAFAPPLNTTDTDVYFFGDVIEKIGAKKYKITNGGFSTCVQPTPRWDLHADTVVLNIDHYTLLRNAILNVKGVPLLYLPVMYYPTQEEDRATGFLIPTYGVSSLRGHSIQNAFFWAINRSQDATFMHDWYSRAGQGFGTEYRYNFGGGSDGELTGYLLNQTATATVDGTLPQIHGRSRCAAPPIRVCPTICACAAASTTSRIWQSCRRSTPTSTTSRATSARMPPTSSARGGRFR